jgi:hypothetical protein
VIDRGADRRRRLLARAPERRAVVEVEDRVLAAAALTQHRLHRRGARLVRQGAAGDPQHRQIAHGLRVDLAAVELKVGDGLGAAEVQLRVLGRVEHGERQRRHPVLADAEEARVDAEPLELAPRDETERVGPDLRVDGGPAAEPGGGDRDVRRRAADRLHEAARLVPVRPELRAVQIDADPADREQLEIPAHRRHGVVVGASAASSLATWRWSATVIP